MGYSTDERGRLCCDACGDTPARKRRCPVGYCQAAALCADCNARFRANGKWAEAHAECPRLSAEYHAQLAAEAAAPHAWARTAWGDWAADVPTGMVKVLTHANTVTFIPKAEYDPSKQLPPQYVMAATPATPEQPVTKQVVL